MSTTPAADCPCTVRVNRSTLSHDSVTCSGSPEVSSTAFHAPPPDLPPVPLMDGGFAIIRSLARHRRPQIQFLSIGSRVRYRLAATPLRFTNPSPPSGWVEDFHPQAVEHARHTKTEHRQECLCYKNASEKDFFRKLFSRAVKRWKINVASAAEASNLESLHTPTEPPTSSACASGKCWTD